MDDPLALHQEVAAFFDAFVVAFSTFDGRQVARLYRAPYLAVQNDGSAVCFNTHSEVEADFQMMVEDYSGKGCHSGRYDDLVVTPLGSQAVVASVTWHIGGADGQTLASWRESYNLVRRRRRAVRGGVRRPRRVAGESRKDGVRESGRSSSRSEHRGCDQRRTCCRAPPPDPRRAPTDVDTRRSPRLALVRQRFPRPTSTGSFAPLPTSTSTPASTPSTRGASAPCMRCCPAGSKWSSDSMASSAPSASGCPARSSARCRWPLPRPSPGCLPRDRAIARDADRAAALLRHRVVGARGGGTGRCAGS